MYSVGIKLRCNKMENKYCIITMTCNKMDRRTRKSVYRQHLDTVKEDDLFEELKAEEPTLKREDYSMREQ